MEIILSRHAKRRAKLYRIPETVIIDVLTNMKLKQGEHEIIENVYGFRYPIKIAVSVEGDILTVITSYPFKKGIGK